MDKEKETKVFEYRPGCVVKNLLACKMYLVVVDDTDKTSDSFALDISDAKSVGQGTSSYLRIIELDALGLQWKGKIDIKDVSFLCFMHFIYFLYFFLCFFFRCLGI